MNFLTGTAVVYTHVSPAKSTPNEDCAAMIPFDEESGVLLIADGLGGLPAGATASQLAANIMAKAVAQHSSDLNLRDAILDGFEKANHTIMQQGSGCATTLAVVELQKHQIRPYHVGDSKILVTGQRGKIKANTISHSPVEYAVEAGMLDENEAVHHEERHLVSNVVGAPDMSITIGTAVKLAKYDTLLVASDGLFDNLYLDEIVTHIRKGPLLKIAAQLVETCHQRMQTAEPNTPSHADDLSFILFRRA